MSKHTLAQPCTKCGKPSIPGLIRGAGKCQFHWNEGVWGTAWALKCEEDRTSAEALAPPSPKRRASND